MGIAKFHPITIRGGHSGCQKCGYGLCHHGMVKESKTPHSQSKASNNRNEGWMSHYSDDAPSPSLRYEPGRMSHYSDDED